MKKIDADELIIRFKEKSLISGSVMTYATVCGIINSMPDLSKPKRQSEKGDWYCPKCKAYLVWQNVTYEETCANCGTPVVWHEPDEPKRQKEITVNGVKFWFTKETHKVLNEDDEEVDEIYYYFRWGDEEFLNAVAMGMNEAKALAKILGLSLPK